MAERRAGPRSAHALMLALALAVPARAQAAGNCPPQDRDTATLQALKAADFAIADAAERFAMAQALLPCLASPDPALRDGIAYEALAHWMRAGDFEAGQLRVLRDALLARLDTPGGAGFEAPFAALVLAEVARTDRIQPWMSTDEREAMVESAARFVEQVRDYRGYDPEEGWRHGVAHGADWLMQLALNPALDRPRLERILAAVASQAVPGTAHAYVFGEPDRLARPVLFVAHRGMLDASDWQAWLDGVAARVGDRDADMAGWLARRHDWRAFLLALQFEAGRSDDPGIRQLLQALAAALED